MHPLSPCDSSLQFIKSSFNLSILSSTETALSISLSILDYYRHHPKMSVVQFPDSDRIPDLQIWNNAAFDAKEADNQTQESGFSKENQSPTLCKSPVCAKEPMPIKPLHPNGATGKSQGKPLKLLFKQGLLAPTITVSRPGIETARDESKIDSEIEEIQKEINRLSSKLESLRLEKADIALHPAERPRGAGATPAKMPLRSNNGTPGGLNAKRRGVSLGPAEILGEFKSQKKGMNNQETTPIRYMQQSRRKSFLLKLEDIDEKGRRSLSLSPKARPTISKIQGQKGFTTIGSRKTEKKDDRRLSSIQPKKLFNEGDKSTSVKKPIKSGRIVPSRYNQTPGQCSRNITQNDRRKTMLPENFGNEGKKSEKIRSSSVGKSRAFIPDFSRANASEVKKKLGNSTWSTLNQESFVSRTSPPSMSKVADLLPKIRTFRRTNESPRDSGPAKRVAELIGRKPYFGSSDISEEDGSVCQVLNFDDEMVVT